ncbi:Ribonuclease H-like superfamily protein, partial [Striga hermonthica]
NLFNQIRFLFNRNRVNNIMSSLRDIIKLMHDDRKYSNNTPCMQHHCPTHPNYWPRKNEPHRFVNKSTVSYIDVPVYIIWVRRTHALPVFTMSCFRLSVSVCKAISSISAQYWWSRGENQEKGIHWKAWKLLTLPKVDGGIGFKDISSFNKALICKQLWRIVSQPDLLVSKVLKDRYFPSCSIFDAKKSQNGSWLWHTWVDCIPILAQGLRTEIHNGAATKISDINWIHSLPLAKPALFEIAQGHITWVKELMQDNGLAWNSWLVKNLFNEKDSKAILSIKTLNPSKMDRIFWCLDKKGEFSVSSTYAYLINQKRLQLDITVNSCNTNLLAKTRIRTWNLSVKGTIKHFLWKCISDSLPVSCNLALRKMDVDVICQPCGEAPETIEHIFFHCPRAQMLWNISPVSWDGICNVGCKFKTWWSHLYTIKPSLVAEDRIQLTTYLLWWLWKSRNLWMFEKIKIPIHLVAAKAHQAWLEIKSVRRYLRDYSSMSYPVRDHSNSTSNRLILDELNYDRKALSVEHEALLSRMTDEQKNVYSKIMDVVDSANGGVFFVYGYGGTGNTYLWKKLSVGLRPKGKIVLCVASSGIASLLLPGGRTALSISSCDIDQASPLAELIIRRSLIIWDKAPMVHKHCFEAIETSLQAIMRAVDPSNSNKPFGGKHV